MSTFIVCIATIAATATERDMATASSSSSSSSSTSVLIDFLLLHQSNRKRATAAFVNEQQEKAKNAVNNQWDAIFECISIFKTTKWPARAKVTIQAGGGGTCNFHTVIQSMRQDAVALCEQITTKQSKSSVCWFWKWMFGLNKKY